MAIWCMRIACWIPKVTDALTICNTHCFSTATIGTRTRLNATLYVHCLSCFQIAELAKCAMIAFPLQQLAHERGSTLRYTYIA